MPINLSNIIEGWSKVVFKDPEIEKLASDRAISCSQCPFSKKGMYLVEWFGDELTEGNMCGVCKCPLAAKLRVKDEICPIGKW